MNDPFHCHQCGQALRGGDDISCTECGAYQLRGLAQHFLTRGDVFIAVLAAIVFPGLGHIYLGDTVLGVSIMFGVLLSFVIPLLGVPVAVFLWLLSVHDILGK